MELTNPIREYLGDQYIRPKKVYETIAMEGTYILNELTLCFRAFGRLSKGLVYLAVVFEKRNKSYLKLKTKKKKSQVNLFVPLRKANFLNINEQSEVNM